METETTIIRAWCICDGDDTPLWWKDDGFYVWIVLLRDNIIRRWGGVACYISISGLIYYPTTRMPSFLHVIEILITPI